LDRPSSGEVHVDGKALSRLDPAGQAGLRREKIGFIFQTFNLIPVLTAAALLVTLLWAWYSGGADLALLRRNA